MAKTELKQPKSKAPKTGPTAPIEFNPQLLEHLCSIGLKIKPVAACMRMSQETLRRRITEHHGQTFEEYRMRVLRPTAQKLIEKAIAMANDGNEKMLMFCLKNLAAWTDKVEHDLSSEQKAIMLRYNLDEPKDVTPEVDDGDPKD